jgi:hypothetical protein
MTEEKRKVESPELLLLLSFARCWRSTLISGLTLFTSFPLRHHHYLSPMTTLTVYFASSPTSPSSSSSSLATNTSITTAIPTTRMIQPVTKPIPIPSSTPPNITLPIPISPVQTPPTSRTSIKRNKTFFERFNQSDSSTHISNSQSPPNQQQQSLDSSNPS